MTGRRHNFMLYDLDVTGRRQFVCSSITGRRHKIYGASTEKVSLLISNTFGDCVPQMAVT